MVWQMALAYFGGGCFWGLEACFRAVPGVHDVTVGYMGGCVPNPTYSEVCSDCTGHAEVVRVEFDDTVISYGQLLDVFWDCHDPTTFNCQGTDFGTQYRSVIFYCNDEQERLARKKKQSLDNSGKYFKEIVTHILPFCEFYAAEEYHQRYFEKNPEKQACHFRPPKEHSL